MAKPHQPVRSWQLASPSSQGPSPAELAHRCGAAPRHSPARPRLHGTASLGYLGWRQGVLAELGHLHGCETNSFAAVKFKVTCRSCTEHQGRANHASLSTQSTGPVPWGHLTPEVMVSFSWVTFTGSVFPGMSALLPPEALPPGSPTGPLADPMPQLSLTWEA